MSDQTFQLIAIAIYFAGMIAIGYYAFRQTKNASGFMLAERGLRPSFAALSANASDMSGWLLLGLPGAIYLSGLSAAWIAIGLIVGAWLNWKFVAPRLRSYTEISEDAITIPSFFDNRLKDKTRILRVSAAVIILVFFTFYVSSGMAAAGVFFDSTFGWPYLTGMLVVAGITLLYTLFGGFLGATLTDVAQGVLMLIALLSVPVVVIISMGGFGPVAASITEVNPEALNLFAGMSEGAGVWILATISTAAWGLGYFGQPHIIVRFMALRTVQDAKIGRRISLTWMLLSVAGTVAAGLVGIAYFSEDPAIALEDPEAVFLVLSRIFFHPLVAGFVLAAVLAAIMSTMSSQLIVCSSALIEDLYKLLGREATPQRQLLLGRMGVLVIAVVALLLALDQNSSILELVSFAWAGFGAAFGPIVLLSLYWKKLTAPGATAGMLVGTITVFIWGNINVLSSAMYEIVPGFLLALVTAIVVSQRTSRTNENIDREFAEMLKSLSVK